MEKSNNKQEQISEEVFEGAVEVVAAMIRETTSHPETAVSEEEVRSAIATAGITDRKMQDRVIEKASQKVKEPVASQPKPIAVPSEEAPKPVTKGNMLQNSVALSAESLRDAEAKELSWMNPVRWQMMEVMSRVFLSSNALPKTFQNASQVIMAIQAGYECGLKPIESLQSFAPINGKMTMYGDTVIAQVKRAGHTVKWGECTSQKATVTITRGDDGDSMTETYTIEEAKAAGLLSKDPWVKYPRRMLKYKVFAEVAHFLVPDALHGVPIAEEMEEVEGEEAKGQKKAGKHSLKKIDAEE